MNTNNAAAAASVFATLALVYGVVLLAVIVFMIWLWWRIFAKAGYNGALSLLNFVPGVGHLICLIILAFGRWPIEDQLVLAPSGTPVAPPGTSVTPSA
ncbi:MAG TPA: hypothetical protein VFF63_07520 [Candidatus Babeliales bacterium]|nr:hypothetical protein [Candidatus Babeliales bacterium]